MGTTFSAKSPEKQRHENASSKQQPLAPVIRRNLDGGDGPLDHLTSTRQAISALMGYLLEYHQLPEPVALEFDAALAHLTTAEVHLRMAATRCS